MLFIISYDVSTETAQGRKRLRKVAKICESMGQRVQKSVFECELTLMQFEDIERRLLEVIKETEDNLRLYRLSNATEWNVRQYGKFSSIDFTAPLVI